MIEIAGHENTGQEDAEQENAKTRTICYGFKAINLCQLRTDFAPRRDNIQKGQSHVRHTLNTLYLKSFNVQQTIIVCKFRSVAVIDDTFHIHRTGQCLKKGAFLFLLELRQISTNFDKVW